MLELNPTAFGAQLGVRVNVKILSIWEVECVGLALLMRCLLAEELKFANSSVKDQAKHTRNAV